MSSPFPGMDPYLEAHWGDVHSSLVLYLRDALRPVLPPMLYPRVEERVVIESPDAYFVQKPVPDVRIVEYDSRRSSANAVSAAVAATAGPVIVDLPPIETTERFLEIRDAGSGHRVVTLIEVLSPGNKRNGEAREQLVEKVQQFRQARTSFVEIDLLRAGRRVVTVSEQVTPDTPYRVCAIRGETPNKGRIYGIPLEERLPEIHIPLRPGDDDAPVDLQRIVDQAYENGNYALTTDYREPPEPPLSATQAEWARGWLQDKIGTDGRVGQN